MGLGLACRSRLEAQDTASRTLAFSYHYTWDMGDYIVGHVIVPPSHGSLETDRWAGMDEQR